MALSSIDSTIRNSKSLCKKRDYLGAVSVLERTLTRFPNNKRIVNEIISIQKKFASSQLELPSVALLNEVLTLLKLHAEVVSERKGEPRQNICARGTNILRARICFHVSEEHG